MKIIVLKGSPNRHGSSNLLAEEFIKGAKETGHLVETVDTATVNVHPCIGCTSCKYDGPCVQKDDMEQIKNQIIAADMIVFASPLYYYGMSAQLKIVIDRFCSFNNALIAKHIKSALLAVAWNQNEVTFDALQAHYDAMVHYLHLEDMGSVLGSGCGNVAATKSSDYPQIAYELGRKIGG